MRPSISAVPPEGGPSAPRTSAPGLRELARLSQQLSCASDVEALLHPIVSALADQLQAVRCSIVLFDTVRGTGWVAAASDDPLGSDFRLDLARYPELRAAIAQERPVLLDDAATDPILGDLERRWLEKDGIRSLIVLPMISGQSVGGALLLRFSRPSPLGPGDLEYLEAATGLLTVSLRAANLAGSRPTPPSRSTREGLSERQLAEFAACATEGLALIDERGRLLSVNPAAARLLGVHERELSSGEAAPRLQEFLSPRSLLLSAPALRELGRGGRVLDAQVAVVSRDGRELSLSLSAVPLRSRPGRSVLTLRDVTEFRAQASELSATGEFLEALVELTSDAVIAVDARGRVTVFNQAAEELTGFPRAEAVGRLHALDLLPREQLRAVLARLAAASAAEVAQLPIELVKQSGQVVEAWLSAREVGAPGSSRATLCVLRRVR